MEGLVRARRLFPVQAKEYSLEVKLPRARTRRHTQAREEVQCPEGLNLANLVSKGHSKLVLTKP